MKITKIVYATGRSGYFNMDLAGIKAGAKQDGFIYIGKTVGAGFKQIAQPGEALSIMLVLEDGQVAFGDCVDVIFTGVAGRDPLFRPEQHLDYLRSTLRERLIGRSVERFRLLAKEIDGIVHQGRKLHTAIRYGISQALLHATALAHHQPIASVIAREYGCQIVSAPIPILASCETHDALMIDRMILKRAELLPHAAFTVVERDLGMRGEKLLNYARHLVARIARIGAPDYHPIIHLDVYGTLGELFENDVDRIAHYLGELKSAVGSFDLLVETPLVMQSRAAQIEQFQALRAALRVQGQSVRIIADEWCNTLEDVRAFADAGAADLVQVKAPDLGGVNNTIEAVLYARRHGTGVSLGGTGNETDQSTRITVQIGLACTPDFLLSKPGFGGDEAMMIETNEMMRTLALLREGA